MIITQQHFPDFFGESLCITHHIASHGVNINAEEVKPEKILCFWRPKKGSNNPSSSFAFSFAFLSLSGNKIMYAHAFKSQSLLDVRKFRLLLFPYTFFRFLTADLSWFAYSHILFFSSELCGMLRCIWWFYEHSYVTL